MPFTSHYRPLWRGLALLSVAVGAGLVAAEPATVYTLTPDELKYDCKQLTGRMQVRILDVRDYSSDKNTTGTSRALQSAVTGLFGGTEHGKHPDDQYATDVARLQAYNRQLVAKNCKSFDLEKELQPKPFRETPSPTVEAPSKAKAKAAAPPPKAP